MSELKESYEEIKAMIMGDVECPECKLRALGESVDRLRK